VTTRLRLLSTKRRAERVDSSVRCRGRLPVQLTGLGEVGASFVEVLRREKSAPLSDGGRQNWGVDAQEAAFIEEIVDRLLDLVPHAKDRPLSWAAKPE